MALNSLILILVFLRVVTANNGNNTVNDEPTVRNVLSLKNINYPISDNNITVKSELKRPLIINVDSEPIFLPLNPKNYHLDKVLERLQLDDDKSSQTNTNDNSLLNFSAYVLKPFKFDYAKVFAQARANAQKQLYGTLPFTTSAPITNNGYNTVNRPHFEGLHYQPPLFKSKYKF